jgi:hypothetical protein
LYAYTGPNRWEATPPPGRPPFLPPRREQRYYGPPAYRSTPRWGFPALAWRWPTSVPGTNTRAPVTMERVRATAAAAVVTLWLLAAAVVFAAGGEVWRYVLLVRSKNGALSKTTVDTSDALVVTGAILAITIGVIALGATVWWVFLARSAAADLAGQDPARPDWQVLMYLFIPGVNLVVPFSVLAELEHAVSRRPVGVRPRPHRLLLWWWGAWVLSALLFAGTLLWRLRNNVQAQADGVLLNVATYLAAAAVAVLTVLVVRRLTTLLAPVNPTHMRLMRVISVAGAPDPPLRPARHFPR